jgi:hypothetical protein
MSKKLQNIKAIQQMLDGSHKFQTKKSVGFSDAKDVAKQNEHHTIGDIWEETDVSGNIYVIEQHDGFRVKKTKNAGVFQEIRNAMRAFPNCQKETCTCTSSHYLDSKMQLLHGMCFDCVIEMEHELRKNGQYEEYEQTRIKQNAMAWLNDAERDLELLKLAYTEASKFVTSGNGEIETWAAKMTPEEFETQIKLKFDEFKQNFIKKLEGDTNEEVL